MFALFSFVSCLRIVVISEGWVCDLKIFDFKYTPTLHILRLPTMWYRKMLGFCLYQKAIKF